METAGWYTCLVSNAIGVEYGSAWLTVVEEWPALASPSRGVLYQDPNFIGGSSGVLIFVILLVIGVFLLLWRRQRQKQMLPQKPMKRIIIMKPATPATGRTTAATVQQAVDTWKHTVSYAIETIIVATL
ncbi:hypothetical protein ACOMHN_063261 [Nucella lapillus]